MTQGIDEVGDLRVNPDSRERYQGRSVTTRFAQRQRRDSQTYFGTHTPGAPTEIFKNGDEANLGRLALEQTVGASLAVRLTAQLATADGARQASLSQLWHVQNNAGTVAAVADGGANAIGDADLTAGLTVDNDIVQVVIDDANATELEFDGVVQLEIVGQIREG